MFAFGFKVSLKVGLKVGLTHGLMALQTSTILCNQNHDLKWFEARFEG